MAVISCRGLENLCKWIKEAPSAIKENMEFEGDYTEKLVCQTSYYMFIISLRN
jgi:hypothetical protein